MESGLVLDFRHPRNAPCRGLANVLSVPPDPPSPLVPTQTFWAYCPVEPVQKARERRTSFSSLLPGFCFRGFLASRRRGAPSTSGSSRSAKSRCPGAPFLTTHPRTTGGIPQHHVRQQSRCRSLVRWPVGRCRLWWALSSPVPPAASPTSLMSSHLLPQAGREFRTSDRTLLSVKLP